MSGPTPPAGVSPRDTYIPQTPATAVPPQTQQTQTQTLGTQSQPPPETSKTTLQQLQQLLPTCQRCRRLRRKCDTQLPHCRPCHRAGVECTMFDHALKQTLPRAYVQSLLTRVEHLEAVKASGGRMVRRDNQPSSTSTTAVAFSATTAASKSTELPQVSTAPPQSTTTTATTPSSATTVTPAQDIARATTTGTAAATAATTLAPSYDVVVPSATSFGKSRYWGASSVFALMVEILQHATARTYVSLEDIGAGGEASGEASVNANTALERMFGHSPDMDHDEQQAGALHHHYYNTNNLVGDTFASAAAEADIRALLRLYLESSNTLYGFVDPEHAFADLEVYLAVRRRTHVGGTANNNTTTTSPNSAFGSMTSPTGTGTGGGSHGSVSSPTTTFGLGSSANAGANSGIGPAALGDQAHSYFRIAMMCAIACATKARYRPQRTAESLAYYADALAYVEEVTAEVSPASLQALLLLIVFCLFFPRKGDVWKLLDYACRLALELGYHTEMEEGGAAAAADAGFPGAAPTHAAPSGESEAQKKLRRSTFWGLYAIERIVGQLFGRGSDLPESIITVSYPSVVVPADVGTHSSASAPPSVNTNTNAATSPAVAPTVDRNSMQVMSIAHHYRLVYLRSEIFRTLYLPARPLPGGGSGESSGSAGEADCQLDWLRRQHQTLHAWRQELAVPAGDEREGVATLTCDVGYDATMCFLFQPLLLRALREGPDFDPSSSSSSSLPEKALPLASDAFYSSIRLIRTYEKIIRAPESSALGAYPITFMSAHYIQLASSTLLANALLRLDGRATVLQPMGDDASSSASNSVNNTTGELDWGAYVDVSSSCLILLAWCGERWPGMLGMLGVYQKLFGRTIREMIGKGIVR